MQPACSREGGRQRTLDRTNPRALLRGHRLAQGRGYQNGFMNLVSIPKLEELAETPAKAKSLPADVRQALTFRAIAALNALYAAGLADETSGRSQAQPQGNGDRLLTAEEAARKLGKSRDALYRNAKKYTFTVRDGRSLRFSEQGIERYIRQRVGR